MSTPWKIDQWLVYQPDIGINTRELVAIVKVKVNVGESTDGGLATQWGETHG